MNLEPDMSMMFPYPRSTVELMPFVLAFMGLPGLCLLLWMALALEDSDDETSLVRTWHSMRWLSGRMPIAVTAPGIDRRSFLQATPVAQLRLQSGRCRACTQRPWCRLAKNLPFSRSQWLQFCNNAADLRRALPT